MRMNLNKALMTWSIISSIIRETFQPPEQTIWLRARLITRRANGTWIIRSILTATIKWWLVLPHRLPDLYRRKANAHIEISARWGTGPSITLFPWIQIAARSAFRVPQMGKTTWSTGWQLTVAATAILTWRRTSRIISKWLVHLTTSQATIGVSSIQMVYLLPTKISKADLPAGIKRLMTSLTRNMSKLRVIAGTTPPLT